MIGEFFLASSSKPIAIDDFLTESAGNLIAEELTGLFLVSRLYFTPAFGVLYSEIVFNFIYFIYLGRRGYDILI